MWQIPLVPCPRPRVLAIPTANTCNNAWVFLGGAPRGAGWKCRESHTEERTPQQLPEVDLLPSSPVMSILCQSPEVPSRTKLHCPITLLKHSRLASSPVSSRVPTVGPVSPGIASQINRLPSALLLGPASGETYLVMKNTRTQGDMPNTGGPDSW